MALVIPDWALKLPQDSVFIYTISPENNKDDIRYVGKSKGLSNLRKRYASHHTEKYNSYKTKWVKGLKKKGIKIEMSILDVSSEDSWKSCERYWIAQLRAWGFRLTNLTEGGDGAPPVSDETRAKISESLKGKTAWNKGKVYTDKNNYIKGKTSLADRNKITELYSTGKYSMNEIALIYGIDAAAARRIAIRRGVVGKRLIGGSATQVEAGKKNFAKRMEKGEVLWNRKKSAETNWKKTCDKLNPLIELWNTGEYSTLRIHREFGVARNTFKRFLDKLGIESNYFLNKKNIKNGISNNI